MARKAKRDLTRREQLTRGPMDLPFLMLVVMLLGVGLVMLLSASHANASYYASSHHDPMFYFGRQAIYALAGLAVMYFISTRDYHLFDRFSFLILVAAFVCLLLVFVPHIGVKIHNARRWIRLGPVQFQPSEIAKLAVVLYFSSRLARRKPGPHKFERRLKPPLQGIRAFLDHIGFLELVPYGAILGAIAVLMLLEPHMSGTILIFTAGASVLFAAGIHLGWFAAGGTLAAGAFWLIANGVGYQSSRIEVWHDPEAYYYNGGYQIIQSLYAIGSGGLLGLGFGQSRQKYLYLPEPENDFVFSIALEELGFIGGSLILLLFVLLIIRGYWLALHARDRFGALTIVGITTLFAVQVFLNIGVITNFLPTTGISLPFFSYGGTALMIQLAEMGIVLSISRQIPAAKQG